MPDEPGAEMQHDTSPFTIVLGQTPTKLQASLLYLRYSKRRYLQFYRVFDRFQMKCFLHRGAPALGLRSSDLHDRQHQSGSVARFGLTSRHGAGDGSVC